MKPSTNYQIIKYLETKDWVYGGTLARAIHDLTGAKESIVERRCRELAEEGTLERSYEQIDDKGPKVVRFMLAPRVANGIKTGYVGEFAGYEKDTRQLFKL